jgi:hypothetical protein
MNGSNFLKKTVITAALAAGMVFSLTAGGQAEAAPSGTDSTVVTELSALHDISLDGIASYKILEGDLYSMEITGDKAFVEALTIENQEGYLAVSSRADQPVELVITAPSIDVLAVSGHSAGVLDGYELDHPMDIYLNKDSSLIVKGEFKAPSIDLYVSMSQIDGSFITENMNVSGHSSSTLNLQGFSRNLNAEITGSSTADFDGMAVSHAKIETRQSASVLADFPGISKVEVDAYNESSLNLTMNGILSADVYTDSTLVYSGDISWAGKTVSNGEDDDASIRMN